MENITIFSLKQFDIGSHTAKKPTLLQTINNFYNNEEKYKTPCQIFLGSPTSRLRSFKEDDILQCKEKIKENKLNVYVHGPYIINLAKIVEDEWNIKLLCKELQIASQLGCKGVVVHVGKYLKLDINEAKDIMEKQIRKCLEYATEDCPLILETPAKQGTELLSTIDEFIQFISRFNDNTNFGICIDTCHVFASDYFPIDYLKTITEITNKIRLVHLNDSKCIKGSCKDRHAFVGKGHIGMNNMYDIIQYCISKNIHMITE